MPADQFSFPPLQGFSTEKEIQISSLFMYFLNLILCHENSTDVCRSWLCLAHVVRKNETDKCLVPGMSP